MAKNERHKTTRWRQLVMDHFDEAMLTFALREAFPRMRIVTDIHHLRRAELDERPHIAQPRQGQNWAPLLYLLFPEESWNPVILPDLPGGHFSYLSNAPRHHVVYRRGNWDWGATFGEEPKWSFSLPTPRCGDFIIDYDRQDERDRIFVRDVWRVMGRLTTNRLKRELPHLGVVHEAEVRSGIWVGHHVLEWCQQLYDRMIDGWFRPVDGWRAPDTTWHREMRARVVARFGHELDEPKEPEGRYHDGSWAVDITSRGIPVGNPTRKG